MKYYVSIPIKGTSTYAVTAASEEGAIEAAWAAVDKGEDGDVTWEFFEDSRTGDTVEVSAPEADQVSSPAKEKP